MSLESQIGDLTTATNNLLAAVNVSKATLDTAVSSASASATSASDSANSTSTAAATAQTAADSASASWAAALAANPDLNPVFRMNPTTITTDTMIPTGYNAYSAGPLTIGEGVTVTLNENANWTIV